MIDYKVEITDHDQVANNTLHYIGAGIQAGSKVLWVDQTDFMFIKVSCIMLERTDLLFNRFDSNS